MIQREKRRGEREREKERSCRYERRKRYDNIEGNDEYEVSISVSLHGMASLDICDGFLV